MSRQIDMRVAWNRTSAGYQRLHQRSTEAAHYGPWAPDERALRLLGDVRGLHILELGCGGGQCSIAFARQGAQVVGVDLSDEQLAFAHDLASQHTFPAAPPVFLQGDAGDLSRFADQSFDVVFSAYALHYVPHIEACLAEVSRVLRVSTRTQGSSAGRLVFSFDHPFRDCFWDDDAGEESLQPMRSYFLRGPMEWQCGPGGEWMRSFHRTVGDWVSLLNDAGLQVERILEPEPVLSAEELASWAESYDLEAARLVPQTIIFVARACADR
jgi:SAM-dependent methyltransferase